MSVFRKKKYKSTSLNWYLRLQDGVGTGGESSSDDADEAANASVAEVDESINTWYERNGFLFTYYCKMLKDFFVLY